MAEMMTTDVRAIMDRTPFDVAAVADLREVLEPRPVAIPDAARGRGQHQGTRAKGEGIQARGPPPAGRRRGAAGPVQLGPRAPEEGRRRRDGLLLPGPRPGEPAAVRAGRRRRSPQAAKLGYDAKNSELHRAGALRRAGKLDGGQEDPRRAGRSSSGSSAEYHFQQGCLLAADGEMAAAAAEFEKALSLDKDHNGALFELAYINDLYGNDDVAVDYYKRCTERPPVPLAAWINLGILYEDEMRFRDAEQCYRQVLAHDPNHPRARLFVKDCQASKGMYYDEEAERRLHRPQAAPRDPGHRLRAVGPQPQLPAEDEHPHARRPDADDRGRAALQQELRRDVAGRDQGDDAGEGPAAGHGAGRQRTRRPRPPDRAAAGGPARDAGDAWPSRSATSTSRSAPASA